MEDLANVMLQAGYVLRLNICLLLGVVGIRGSTVVTNWQFIIFFNRPTVQMVDK